MGIKKSEISITSNGNKDYQVVINNICVTDAFKTKEDAYKDYIRHLVNMIDDIRDTVYRVKTF